MPTVNLHDKYRNRLTNAFEYTSQLGGKTSSEYEWKGVNSIKLTSLVTDPLTDYNRAASAGRYGTPSEVGDELQIMTLDKDRSYTKTVDKGNYQEASFLKTGASVVSAYMNEQVSPELEQYFYKRMLTYAGQVLTISAAPTSSTVIGMLTDIETAFDDKRVPKTERYVAVPHKYIACFRQALTNCDDITDKLLLKGIVGNFGSLHILGVSENDIPANCFAIAWQKSCAVFPKTIDDCKVSHDVPGISGMLVEARFRYGAFVVGKRSAGVIAVVLNGKKASASISISTHAATITASNAGAVYYTLDGTDPRYSSTAVKWTSGTVATTAGTTIKVAVFNKADWSYFSGDVASATDS